MNYLSITVKILLQHYPIADITFSCWCVNNKIVGEDPFLHSGGF